MFVLDTPTGPLYACSERCVFKVTQIVARSRPTVVLTRWDRTDRDVFCTGCTAALGIRRCSARLLQSAMTPVAWDAYQALAGRARSC